VNQKGLVVIDQESLYSSVFSSMVENKVSLVNSLSFFLSKILIIYNLSIKNPISHYPSVIMFQF